MQERADGLKLEIHRKEAHISILQQKLNRCEESLRETLCELPRYSVSVPTSDEC